MKRGCWAMRPCVPLRLFPLESPQNEIWALLAGRAAGFPCGVNPLTASALSQTVGVREVPGITAASDAVEPTRSAAAAPHNTHCFREAFILLSSVESLDAWHVLRRPYWLAIPLSMGYARQEP